MNQLLQQLIEFGLYLILQALAINGIYISAKGGTDIAPDGTERDSEMILYPLYKFLNQNWNTKVFFTKAQIKKRVGNNWPLVLNFKIDWEESADGTGFKVTPYAGLPMDFSAVYNWAQKYLQAQVIFDQQNMTLRFYQDIETYKYSKYLRKPIITCIICMPSFWSIFLFLIPALCIFGVSLNIFLIWIGNVFCLSYLNYLIFKPRK